MEEGITAIAANCGGPTVAVAEPETPPEAAVTVTFPWALEVASPVALMVTTSVAEEVHVATEVRSFVLPLL